MRRPRALPDAAPPVGRWVGVLLAVYPTRFRREYGAEMALVVRDQLQGRSALGRLVVVVRAVADVLRTAPVEWAAWRPAPVVAAAGVALAPGGPAVVRGPTRRVFLGRALQLTGLGVVVAFGGATVGYLWPDLRGGFGALVDVGPVAEMAAAVRDSQTVAVPAAKAYLVAFDPADDPEGLYGELTDGTGLMALSHRCAHLGCRVPWCEQSSRFECPCHKSRYNRWGEYVSGPAPRGLDRHPVMEADGRLLIDTRVRVTGPAISHGALAEPASGPSCL